MHSQRTPEFILYTGPMFAAKTTSLLMTLNSYEFQGLNVRLFKPVIDSRYSDTSVVTHNGLQRQATGVTNGVDILKHIEASNLPDVVAVDEAFMIPECSKSLIWLYKHGTTIVVSSLELNYNGKPFKEVYQMFPWATSVQKLTAVCSVCHQPTAHFSYKKHSDSEDEIVVGGKELYEARCFHCHPIINKKPGEYTSD